MVRWLRLVLLILPSGCNLGTVIKGKGAAAGDNNVSLFSSYSGQYCEIADKEGTRSIRANCENLRQFTDSGSTPCQMQGSWSPERAYFPNKKQAMNLCQDYARPQRAEQKVIRFAVLGDTGADEGTHVGSEQRKVGQALQRICAANSASDLSCNFVMILGDMVYPSGVVDVWDQKFRTRFEDMYRAFDNIDFYITVGNHDYLGNVEAMREYTWFSGRWQMPGRYYSIPNLPTWLHIFELDTMRAVGEFGKEEWSDQKAALEKELCGLPGWRFIAGHYPAYSHGAHGDHGGIQARLNQLTEQCPFQIYFAGHDHHQEHMNGPQYDVVIQGAGGAEIRNVKVVSAGSAGDDPTVQNFARAVHGFAIVEVSETTLDMWFYDAGKWAYAAGEFTEDVNRQDFIYRCHGDLENFKGCQPVP